jgi:hypothetical protein
MEDAMLAFVANTTASWESIMNNTDSTENDRAQNLFSVAASDDPISVFSERVGFVGSSRTERECGKKGTFLERFIPILLRALSAWNV